MARRNYLKVDFDDGSAVELTTELVLDFVRVGLVAEKASDADKCFRVTSSDLSLFLPLLTSYDVRLVPMSRDGCPYHFCTGILKMTSDQRPAGGREPGPIPAGGQSGTAVDAALGCLGELSERVSLWTLGDQDERIFLAQETQPEVEFGDLLGLSVAQGRVAARQMSLKEGQMKAGIPDWAALSKTRINVRSFKDGSAAQLPSVGVLFREMELRTGQNLSFASSVGCAVWRDLDGARERALLELVERDAIAQCWYNRLGITRLEKSFLLEILADEVIGFMSAQERSWGLFSVETDLDVHVVMAVSHDVNGYRTAFGAAAGFDIACVCVSALQEMLQSENALHLMEKAYPADIREGGGNLAVPRHLAYARKKSILEDLPLNSAPPAAENLAKETYSYEGLLQGCLERNIEIWEFDATRSDLKIPCVKLLSPDLCSWEPRFGKERLFQGVIERGLRSVPATEAEFAARPFPF